MLSLRALQLMMLTLTWVTWAEVHVYPLGHWDGGFSAEVDLQVPHDMIGWRIHVIFSLPITTIEFWAVDISKINDYEYVFSNKDFNSVLHAGEVFRMTFNSRSPGDLYPEICAFFEGMDPPSVCPLPGQTAATATSQSTTTTVPGQTNTLTSTRPVTLTSPGPNTVTSLQPDMTVTQMVSSSTVTVSLHTYILSSSQPSSTATVTASSTTASSGTSDLAATVTAAMTQSATSSVTDSTTSTSSGYDSTSTVTTSRPTSAAVDITATTPLPPTKTTTLEPESLTTDITHQPPVTTLASTAEVTPTSPEPTSGHTTHLHTSHHHSAEAVYPYDCNFDSGVCAWVNSTAGDDQFDWTLMHGTTPTAGTGPSVDHTLGQANGWYIYIETSTGAPGNAARLESPVMKANQIYCLTFWYHLYGATLGSLNVRTRSHGVTRDPIWSRDGPSENQWKQGVVEIPAQSVTFQFIIEGVRGNSYLGDAAIDDIQVRESSCTP